MCRVSSCMKSQGKSELLTYFQIPIPFYVIGETEKLLLHYVNGYTGSTGQH